MRGAWLFNALSRLLPERSAMPGFCHKLQLLWLSSQGRSTNAFPRSHSPLLTPQ